MISVSEDAGTQVSITRNAAKFAIQLDSDDVYKDEHTLQIMVNAFMNKTAPW